MRGRPLHKDKSLPKVSLWLLQTQFTLEVSENEYGHSKLILSIANMHPPLLEPQEYQAVKQPRFVKRVWCKLILSFVNTHPSPLDPPKKNSKATPTREMHMIQYIN